MAEDTQSGAPTGSPTEYGYCSWHDRFAADVRLIELTAASTVGKVHYACPQCVHRYSLTPHADQPADQS
ncbi:hypothetical protein [Streptomyces sp. cmx-10-25]|uniref:hypothetical protein n=1 Tax=Streptomyces sp. cmx-10-25 TaxID=2790919 RepID=UPI00397F9A4A